MAMATADDVKGVLARLLLDKPNTQDESSAPHLLELWLEHLHDADARDLAAACTAILADPEARFPTVGQFMDEVQIQGRDRVRREIPPDVADSDCHGCGGLGYVFVEAPAPWTVRPCDQCNSQVYDLWNTKHLRPNHRCRKCDPTMRRRADRNRPRTPSVPARPDLAAAQERLGDF